MADLSLNILVVPTYDAKILAIADISTYPVSPVVDNPTIVIDVPSFGIVTIPFTISSTNIFNSTTLGITSGSDALTDLPDGVYTLTYSVTPSSINFVTKTILRVDQLQVRYDNAFMTLDMMQCDLAIKTQQKVDLSSIAFIMQGSISAANGCAVETSNKLYSQASRMLHNFMRNGCQCSGTNYLINL